jgi:hypothetical protein
LLPVAMDSCLSIPRLCARPTDTQLAHTKEDGRIDAHAIRWAGHGGRLARSHTLLMGVTCTNPLHLLTKLPSAEKKGDGSYRFFATDSSMHSADAIQ